MATALRLRPNTLPLPAMPAPVDPLLLLPDYARAEAERCLGIIRPALIRVQQGVSIRCAANLLATSAEGMPSAPTLQRWLRDYIQGGIVELAPKYKGRERKLKGWEARALQLFNQPQRPGYATVAYWLRCEGFTSAHNKAVERYLKAAPSNLTDTGKKRLGAHYYAQNIRPHIVRDNTVLSVGSVYEGDGHCCDVYVAHPAKGHFRPELTVWIDVRSHYVVGWWISESESAHTTLFSLSDALVKHQHVPDFVHTDPGSGFKAHMISDQTAGFLAKFGITPMLALPGNAKGKGLIEGWFRWFEERCGKRFTTFCGHCRTDDDLSRLSAKIKRGDIELPTLAQYKDAITAYVDAYNKNAQEGLGNQSPAQLWAGLQRNPLHTPAEAIIRPREERTVRRWGVELDNRKYRAAELQAYESRKVLIEYSVHTDDRVWVLDLQGRYLCDALLVEKKPWMPESRIEQAQLKRLEDQHKRHQRLMDEQSARSRAPISPSAFLDALDAHEASNAITHQPDDQFLAQGHSLSAPAAPAKAVRHIAPVDTTAVQEAMEEDAAPRDTPEQRFARALRLEQQGSVDEAETTWLANYQTSAEYHSRRDLHDEFNGN